LKFEIFAGGVEQTSITRSVRVSTTLDNRSRGTFSAAPGVK
jgi:hypothetical protein